MVIRCASLLCAAALLYAIVAYRPDRPPTLPGYDAELVQMDDSIRALTVETSAPHRLLRLAHAAFSKASLSAEFTDFRAAEDAIIAAEKAGEPAAECAYLQASFNLKMHRLAATAQSMERLTHLADVPEIAVLRADLLFQQGKVAGAAALYEKLSEAGGSWDVTARLAWIKSREGKSVEADRLYAAAQNELTAKEMRPWAWLELQRGLLDLNASHFAEALVHCEKADRAWPGYWLIQEHIAALIDRLGRPKDAATLYRSIIARTHRPEFVSALAAVEHRTDPAAAGLLSKEARTLFEQQRQCYPEAAIGHFLEYLIALPGDPDPELLALAEENFRLRPNADAMLLKARVCLRLHDPAAARRLLAAAQDAGWRSAQLYESHSHH